jgi:hypothetical protein
MCFDYDGEPEFGEAKQVKCRKPHKCKGCRKTIQPGQQAERSSGLFDEHFFRYYTCEDCQRLQISIAYEEIKHGCAWHTAWCNPDDLQEYVDDRLVPVTLLSGTIAECRKQVDDLFAERRKK